ncbi:MAG: short-chain fatty acid transporter [Deltaproteobacteria bacterium]|nr:short-chain fatty acid transporter [Deltaproteobacteria bacterium]
MIRRLGHRFAAFFRATTPDPFVLAIALTIFTFFLAAVATGVGPKEIVEAWQGDKGFFSLLAFTMQMVLILVTGHALASAPLLQRALGRIAVLPQTGASAAFLVSFVAIAMSLLNWGLGLVVGAILAREVGRSCSERGVAAHYPLLSAAGYTGLMTWHGGFSGSAPLMMTTEANVARFLGDDVAAEVGTLSFTETVLGPMNLVVTLGLIVIVPSLCAALAPRRDEPSESMTDYLGENAPTPAPAGRYREAVANAVAGTSGIVLQFPFYAGIMGVIRSTGLGAMLATWMTSAATPQLYGVLTMVSAGVINLFVPSGGGQWAVQGPVAVEASSALGVPLSQAVMAVAYGDQLTNMLQPFWALPLLAITGAKARDIIGYTALVMVAGALWMGGVLFFW